MANKSTVSFTGGEELSAVLRQIPKEVRSHILERAMKNAVVPVVVAAKRFARRSEDTGALRDSIDSKVKSYKGGAVSVGMVGATRGYFRNGKKLAKTADRRGADAPSKYSHLVEFGHKARDGSFVRAKPFLRPALATTKDKVHQEMVKGIGKGIKSITRKMVKQGVHVK